jgi:hypothetical protein
VIDVAARLTAPDLARSVDRLGFRGDDVAAVLGAAAVVSASEADLARVLTLATRLESSIGDFGPGPGNPLEHEASRAEHLGVGVLPLLALLVTAPDVSGYHQERGISQDVSTASLADLGQQAWVHRQTFGTFGLHTYWWLSLAWSGALYRLGRLQFNLQQEDARWVLSTHIPATGPLAPAAVDDAFTRAADFFARHFQELPTEDFHCASWLLDPELAAALDPASNIVHFQRRWQLYGEPMPGDQDALFFTFFRRGGVDLATLPQETSLQRAVVGRLRQGRRWSVWQGRIPQSTFRISTTRIESP